MASLVAERSLARRAEEAFVALQRCDREGTALRRSAFQLAEQAAALAFVRSAESVRETMAAASHVQGCGIELDAHAEQLASAAAEEVARLVFEEEVLSAIDGDE